MNGAEANQIMDLGSVLRGRATLAGQRSAYTTETARGYRKMVYQATAGDNKRQIRTQRTKKPLGIVFVVLRSFLNLGGYSSGLPRKRLYLE